MGNFARYKPRRTRAKYLEGAPDYVADHPRDNGGKSADRYTVTYTGKLWSPELPKYWLSFGGDPRTVNARAMSENPFSAQGVGLFVDCVPGPHLGKLIKWADLPEECKRCVIRDGCDD